MASNNDKTEARKKALKEFLIGAGVAAAGGIITFISYSTAKPGERYTIFTGVIALGIVYAVHGLFRMVFPAKTKESGKADNPAVADKVDDEEDEIAE